MKANFPQVLCAIDDLNVSLNMSEQDQRDYKNKKRQKAEGEIAELWETAKSETYSIDTAENRKDSGENIMTSIDNGQKEVDKKVRTRKGEELNTMREKTKTTNGSVISVSEVESLK